MLGEGHRGVQFLNCPRGEGPVKRLLLALLFMLKPGDIVKIPLFFLNLMLS